MTSWWRPNSDAPPLPRARPGTRWRRVSALRICTVTAGFTPSLLFPFLHTWMPSLSGRSILWTFILIIPAIVLVASYLKSRHRLKKALERHDYRLCVVCEYELSAEPQHGTCPECGTAYSVWRTFDVWRKRLNLTRWDVPKHLR